MGEGGIRNLGQNWRKLIMIFFWNYEYKQFLLKVLPTIMANDNASYCNLFWANTQNKNFWFPKDKNAIALCFLLLCPSPRNKQTQNITDKTSTWKIKGKWLETKIHLCHPVSLNCKHKLMYQSAYWTTDIQIQALTPYASHQF